MMDNFIEFLAGEPYKMDEDWQQTWAYFVGCKMSYILRDWHDPSFRDGDVWKKDGAYYESLRQKLVAMQAFKKKCNDADETLRALKLLVDFFAHEKRNEGAVKPGCREKKCDAKKNDNDVMPKFEVVIMCGIPGSGKTTFCRERLFPQYLYISLDRLRSRSAEAELFAFALRRRKSCVIDNTNVNGQERARYVPAAKKAGARVVAYWFEPDVQACKARNAGRTGRERVPDFVIGNKSARFAAPSKAEGFDDIRKVSIVDDCFKVEEEE